MYEGLNNLLKMIAKYPKKDILKERFLALLTELTSEEQCTQLLLLAKTCMPKDPIHALDYVRMAYVLNPRSEDILQLGEECLIILGKEDKAKRLEVERKKIFPDLLTSVVALQDIEPTSGNQIQKKPEEAVETQAALERDTVSAPVAKSPTRQSVVLDLDSFDSSPQVDTLKQNVEKNVEKKE